MAPTVSTKAGGHGADSTQLRLHGRWMDLATQAAEAPTQDNKKKLMLGDKGKGEGSDIVLEWDMLFFWKDWDLDGMNLDGVKMDKDYRIGLSDGLSRLSDTT